MKLKVALLFFFSMMFLACQNSNTEKEFVDLGLSVKWASFNIGASEPMDFGCFYTCEELNISKTGGADSCEVYNDVVRDNWGDNWRIPTAKEFRELIDKCQWEWGSLNGINGCLVIGPNGNSIFLPAAGYCSASSNSFKGDPSLCKGLMGCYWSSSSIDDWHNGLSNYMGTGKGWHLGFASSDKFIDNSLSGFFAMYVRPVSD